jgi:hypothetical protein
MVAGSSNWTSHTAFHMAPPGYWMMREPGSSLLLWVDAVGGFLVCGGDRIVLGQAVPSAGVDVPIQADVSRRHLTIHRDEEGYVAAAAARTEVDGQQVHGAANLRDGSIIQLSSRVRLQFRQPHPLSATARLNLVSHHRTQPAVDGIILMADTLILGPSANCHIVSRHLAQEVVLFRRDQQWTCRTEGEIEVNGDKWHTEAQIGPGSTVIGRDFSFTLESA